MPLGQIIICRKTVQTSLRYIKKWTSCVRRRVSGGWEQRRVYCSTKERRNANAQLADPRSRTPGHCPMRRGWSAGGASRTGWPLRHTTGIFCPISRNWSQSSQWSRNARRRPGRRVCARPSVPAPHSPPGVDVTWCRRCGHGPPRSSGQLGFSFRCCSGDEVAQRQARERPVHHPGRVAVVCGLGRNRGRRESRRGCAIRAHPVVGFPSGEAALWRSGIATLRSVAVHGPDKNRDADVVEE